MRSLGTAVSPRRRALSMTEGFHPKPRINFPSALAVGIAGLDELLEIDLAEAAHGRIAAGGHRTPVAAGHELSARSRCCRRRIAKRRSRTSHSSCRFRRIASAALSRSHRLAVGANIAIRIARDGRKTPLDLRPLIDEFGARGRHAAHAIAMSIAKAAPGRAKCSRHLANRRFRVRRIFSHPHTRGDIEAGLLSSRCQQAAAMLAAIAPPKN